MEWNKPVPIADLKEGDHIYVHLPRPAAGVTATSACTLSHHGKRVMLLVVCSATV